MNDAPKTDNAFRLAKCYSADDESGEVDWRKVAVSMEAHGRALERENARLREALTRCLPIVQADAQMVADITRFAPLDPASQAKHDTTEAESERLMREIPVLLGLPNP